MVILTGLKHIKNLLLLYSSWHLFSCPGDPLETSITNTFHIHTPSSIPQSVTASLPLFICLPPSQNKEWEKGESHWHSLTSLLLTCVQRAICRSVRQKALLSLGVTQQVSTALSHANLHTYSKILGFFKEGGTHSLWVCLPAFSLCTLGRQMCLSWWRLKEGFASVFQPFFPEESRCVAKSE